MDFQALPDIDVIAAGIDDCLAELLAATGAPSRQGRAGAARRRPRSGAATKPAGCRRNRAGDGEG